MADAETAVVQDAHLGGHPGVPARHRVASPVPRRGFPPTDGPDIYTAGTLFPRSSKKAARAINAASGNRPLVVLANLSGFDGSPDSMRSLQLEYGAEIGRAIVNFDGPDRLRRRLALPRRRVRRVLQGAQPAHDGARRRGLVRLGHRRRPGGRGRLRPRRRRPHRGRPPGRASSRPGSARPRGAERAPARRRARRGAHRRAGREARRGGRRVRQRSTTSTGPSRSARSTPSSAPASSGRAIIAAIEAGLGG